MRKTLADAGLEPEQIDHINAHGTATPENDKMEYNTTAVVFGEHLPKIPVSSNKSMVGHTISAAGAVEAVFSLLTLEHQRIPPTINYEIPDPAILFDVVGNTARDAKVTAVMSNSFGFGGQNASLILTREPVSQARRLQIHEPPAPTHKSAPARRRKTCGGISRRRADGRAAAHDALFRSGQNRQFLRPRHPLHRPEAARGPYRARESHGSFSRKI